jgi:hypothetical protein
MSDWVSVLGEARYRIHKAHYAVNRAIKFGKLPNLKTNNILCVDCKKQRATDYEHRDYDEPLKVDPVCRSCNHLRGSEKGALMARICQLPDCSISFIPTRPWQLCCSKDHGRKLRYLRRKEKQAKLLAESRLDIAVGESITHDIQKR